MYNLPKKAILSISAASGHPGGDTVEIREKSPAGKLFGTCKIPDTGGWDKYQTFQCPLQTDSPKSDICLLLKGGKGELVRLDWLKINSATESTQ